MKGLFEEDQKKDKAKFSLDTIVTAKTTMKKMRRGKSLTVPKGKSMGNFESAKKTRRSNSMTSVNAFGLSPKIKMAKIGSANK
jgi:hypothetical protein